jgi:hypothetical protein
MTPPLVGQIRCCGKLFEIYLRKVPNALAAPKRTRVGHCRDGESLVVEGSFDFYEVRDGKQEKANWVDCDAP